MTKTMTWRIVTMVMVVMIVMTFAVRVASGYGGYDGGEEEVDPHAMVGGDEKPQMERCGPGERLGQSLATITSNGCGSAGMKIDIGHDELTPCCDIHDACYGTCGVPMAHCEVQFKRCLDKRCAAIGKRDGPASGKECSNNANMFIMGTRMFGQSAYDESQRDACECVSKSVALRRYLSHIRSVYNNADNLFSVDEIDAKMTKAEALLNPPADSKDKGKGKYGRGKEWKLMAQLYEQYPSGITKHTHSGD